MYKKHPKFTREELLEANENHKSYRAAAASLGIPGKVFRRQLFKSLGLEEPLDPDKKICRGCYKVFSREEELQPSWNRKYVCTKCKQEVRKASNRQSFYRRRDRINKSRSTDEYRSKMRDWNSRNKDKIAHYKALRRVKYREGNTPEVKEFIKELYSSPDRKCRYCPETKSLTLEHVLPLSRGGKHECSNLDLACSTCNSSKNNKTEEEYKEYLDIIKGHSYGT